MEPSTAESLHRYRWHKSVFVARRNCAGLQQVPEQSIAFMVRKGTLDGNDPPFCAPGKRGDAEIYAVAILSPEIRPPESRLVSSPDGMFAGSLDESEVIHSAVPERRRDWRQRVVLVENKCVYRPCH
jgi:hypothetical protein